MDPLVDCVDPWGRRTVLTEGQWWGHVVDEHAILHGHEAAVRLTLTDPDVVTRDANEPDRRCFYRRWSLPTLRPGTYLKVVVDFGAGVDRGFLVTAYPTGQVKRKELIEWQR